MTDKDQLRRAVRRYNRSRDRLAKAIKKFNKQNDRLYNLETKLYNMEEDETTTQIDPQSGVDLKGLECSCTGVFTMKDTKGIGKALAGGNINVLPGGSVVGGSLPKKKK